MKNICLKSMYISSLMLISMLSHAQQNEIYRYKNAEGNIVYTDKIPRNKYIEIEILSKKTGIVKSFSETKNSSNNSESYENAEETVAKLQEEEQRKKDQLLLNTYSSIEEIEKLKKYELEQIDRVIQNDNGILATINDRKKLLQDELKNNRLKPSERNMYEAELSRLNETFNRTVSNLDKNKRIYLEREQKYNIDKERFIAIMKIIKSEEASR